MQKALVIGDLHWSDSYTGKHKDYLANCIDINARISSILLQDKYDMLILTGDLFGVKNFERKLKDRESLLYFHKLLSNWNKYTENNVYTVIGNHDIADSLGDFAYFQQLGLLKNLSHVDMGNVRFHLVNYGESHRELSMLGETTGGTDIIVAHDNFTIEGVTNWYKAGEGIPLSKMKNFYGADLVLAGHIHNPSSELSRCQIEDKPIDLFYLGCPTRPRKEKNNWDFAWGGVVTFDGVNAGLEFIKFELTPASEAFIFEDLRDYEGEELEDFNTVDLDRLKAVLSELNHFQLANETDIVSQIMTYGAIDEDARNLALKYINASMNN